MEEQPERREHPESVEFETIVANYINDVRKLIFSYVKNHQTMEDLTQEVFLSVYNNFQSFRGESSFKTWLFKIAVNRTKDYLKSWHCRYTTLTNYFQDKELGKTTENQLVDSLRIRS
ncbi:sigma-70 family RNA polymerase sigma factor [Bacillus sp. T33-2]|uniref:sigma-70 family RNA polymerase sigma factor n=1 Tax=Bacillus sp. T33-2 TaxID=2054168 RepID=UPI0015E11853|nr:sigma-70 family RNA polymerase sigma factor [Bacillus sp. T33-2]